MDEVVPGALQRLRAADIMRMAGLTVASLGQEYCRIGAVQATKREGAKLSGIVVVNSVPMKPGVFPSDSVGGVEATEGVTSEKYAYSVAVEVQDPNSWMFPAPAPRSHPPFVRMLRHCYISGLRIQQNSPSLPPFPLHSLFRQFLL